MTVLACSDSLPFLSIANPLATGRIYANDTNNMIPMIKNHQYKKSMINP